MPDPPRCSVSGTGVSEVGLREGLGPQATGLWKPRCPCALGSFCQLTRESLRSSLGTTLGVPRQRVGVKRPDRWLPSLQVTTVKFWFATGGAGFCLSRGLALKMSPWAR